MDFRPGFGQVRAADHVLPAALRMGQHGLQQGQLPGRKQPIGRLALAEVGPAVAVTAGSGVFFMAAKDEGSKYRPMVTKATIKSSLAIFTGRFVFEYNVKFMQNAGGAPGKRTFCLRPDAAVSLHCCKDAICRLDRRETNFLHAG